VHLLSLDAEDPDAFEARRRAFHSVAAIARAVDEISPSHPISLDLLTAGVFDVIGGDARSPLGALAHGAGLGIRHDLESVRTRTIDLGLEPGEPLRASAPRLAGLLGEEGEGTIALRRGEVWVREFPLLERAPEAVPPPGQDGGCLLITGGTGGIGLALASRLAGPEGPPLVLVSRSGGGDEERLARLAATGAQIVVERADVTSEPEMAAVMERAVRRFGRIRGAVHAAGVADHALVVNDTLERAEAVLAPKVVGAIVLERFARRFELDFICLCSSLTGLEGARGATSYAAANAFLDALAAAHDATGPRVVSVDLDVWRESGMAVAPGSGSDPRDPFLSAGLSDDEGVAALWHCLTLGEPQALVAAGPVAERIDPPDDGEEAGGAVAAEVRPKRDVAAIWAEVLGLDGIAGDDQLEALGVTSLQAMKVAARVKKAYGVRLPVRAVLRAKTPNELERALADPA
jgi:NAD(P)-dependent dehydrogenase (short-subunit alcohol dehydrogenase family)/acyl carrier protein